MDDAETVVAVTARTRPSAPMASSTGWYAAETENRLGNDGYHSSPTGERPIETMTSPTPMVASNGAIAHRREREWPSGNHEKTNAKQATSDGRWTLDAAHAPACSSGSIGRNAW